MQAIVANVAAAFRARVNASTWMTPATKQQALTKLRTLYIGIGYPDRWQDYSDLRIDTTDAVGNLRRIEDRNYRQALARLGDAIRQTSADAVFSIGITPQTLLVEGVAADQSQQAIADAAAMLHDRDIVQLTFVGEVPIEPLRAFLRVLTVDAAERRSRGGPATLWFAVGHPSITID